jgi:hypothetical protein
LARIMRDRTQSIIVEEAPRGGPNGTHAGS